MIALLGWGAATGCLVPNPEPRTPCYAAVKGTLWPPAGEPLFAVSARHVRLERAGEALAETDTDRRGRFELRADRNGAYVAAFSDGPYTATADVKLGGCYSSEKLDLFVKKR
jgi:hypothetical protein